VSRSAGHCAETQELVNEIAGQWFDSVFNPADQSLIISQLNKQALARQRLIIRQWFACLGLKMPAQAVVERILFEVVAAREQAEPLLTTQGRDVRRYRDKLYCLPQADSEIRQSTIWPSEQQSIMINHGQTLTWVNSSSGVLADYWHTAEIEIKFRSGGEKISLPGRAGRHTLKKLFQEASIPPWEREQMPLIYLNGGLAAVGEHWISAEFYGEKTAGCVSLVWQR